MRNALAWFTLGVVGVSLATASCGDDEATGGDDDGDAGGGVIESGGSSGKGGSAGSGGKAGSSGSGGSSGTGAGKLGQACVTDNECGTTGLSCLENDEMAGSGP